MINQPDFWMPGQAMTVEPSVVAYKVTFVPEESMNVQKDECSTSEFGIWMSERPDTIMMGFDLYTESQKVALKPRHPHRVFSAQLSREQWLTWAGSELLRSEIHFWAADFRDKKDAIYAMLRWS